MVKMITDGNTRNFLKSKKKMCDWRNGWEELTLGLLEHMSICWYPDEVSMIASIDGLNAQASSIIITGVRFLRGREIVTWYPRSRVWILWRAWERLLWLVPGRRPLYIDSTCPFRSSVKFFHTVANQRGSCIRLARSARVYYPGAPRVGIGRWVCSRRHESRNASQ